MTPPELEVPLLLPEAGSPLLVPEVAPEAAPDAEVPLAAPEADPAAEPLAAPELTTVPLLAAPLVLPALVTVPDVGPVTPDVDVLPALCPELTADPLAPPAPEAPL